MNGFSKGKKDTFYPERAVNFKSFFSAEKSKLRTAYPFLSDGQINGKIKEKWKLLEHRKRQCHFKAAQKVTPSKGKTIQSAKKSSRRQKKSSIDVCDTPENVNLYRLSDFRKQHTERYESDFDADVTNRLSIQNYGKAGTSSKRKTSTDQTSYVQGQQAKPSQFDWNWTDGVDNEDSSCQMLMKRKEDEEDIDIGDTESLESDEDNDGVLIRRTDLGDENDVDMGMTVGELDNSDERSENTHEDRDNEYSYGYGKENVQNTEQTMVKGTLNSYFKESKNSKEQANKSDATENACYGNNTDDTLFKSPDPKGSTGKKCSGRKTRRSAPANLETPNISSNMHAALTPQASNSNEDTEKYTTPQMDEVLQKLTIHEVNKAPQKRRHSFESVDRLDKVKAAVSGRRVTRSLLALQSELIDHTDGDLIDGNGASSEVIASENNMRSLRNKGQKSSYLSLKSKRSGKDENNNIIEQSDVTETHTGDSIEETGMKSEKDKADKFNSTKSFDVKDSKKDVEKNTIQMNPSGDASQIDKEDMDVNCSIQTEVIDNNKGDSKKRLKRKLKVIKADHNAKRKKEETTTQREKRRSVQTDTMDNFSTNSSVSSRSESQSSTDFGSSPASSLRSLTSHRKSYRNTECSNPALEKVLESLRSTRMTSPTWSCSNSNVSSPRLLSPALSGVSELSSLSDQCPSEQQRSVDIDAYVKTVQKQDEKDLCDLFKDVTPPESKTKGLYKTARMVTSGPQGEVTDFKQLFQDERDDMFF